MQAVWTRLADELIGALLVFLLPLVLDLQLAELLCSCQRRLETVGSAGEVVLRLVKDLLRLKDLQNPLLPVELGLCEEEFGQLLNIDVGLGPLLIQELRALGTGRLEVLDPLRSWHDGCHCE